MYLPNLYKMKDLNFNNCCGQMMGADGSQEPAEKSIKQKVIVIAGLIAFTVVAVMLLKKVIK
jgi:hypothetical protein